MKKSSLFVIFFLSVVSCSHKSPVKESKDLVKKGEYKKAIKYIREVSKETSYSEQDELNILLGISYLRTRKYGKAKDILFSLSPKSASLKKLLSKALLELGDSARKIGYTKMAEQSYEIALVNDPEIKLGRRYLLLINQSYGMGDCELVVRFSDKYIAETQDTQSVFTKYVECLYEDGEWDKIDSLKEYFISHRRIDDLGWALGDALYNIAVSKLSMGFVEDAKDVLLEFTTKIRSPHILMDDAYFLLGGIYEEMGYPDSALSMYYKCMKESLTNRSPLYKASTSKVKALKDEMGLH